MDVLHDRLIWQVLSGGHAFSPLRTDYRKTHASYPLGTASNPLGSAPALLLALIHRSAWNGDSRKFISKILHSTTPIPLQSPSPGTPHSPGPLGFVTAMDRYARLWMLSHVRGLVVCPAPRSSLPCAWPLSAPPLPPRARSLGVGGGRHTPGWLTSGGRLPSGQPAPPPAPRGRGPCPWLRPSGLVAPLLYLPNTLHHQGRRCTPA